MLRRARGAARSAWGLTDVGPRRPRPTGARTRAVTRRRAATVAVVALAASALATGPATVDAASDRGSVGASIVRFGPAVGVPDGAPGLRLAAVSCVSTTSCHAVGTDAAGDGVVLDGAEASGIRTWRAPRVLGAGAIGAATLTSISCPSAVRCVAVGGDHLGQAVAAEGSLAAGRWRWGALVRLAADATGGGTLDAVSCPSPTRCVAVGSDAAARPIFAADTWTGTTWTWSPATSIAADASGGATLRAISLARPAGAWLSGATRTALASPRARSARARTGPGRRRPPRSPRPRRSPR